MRRLQVSWPAINDGFEYANTIKGRKGEGAGLTVLDFYATKFSSTASRAEWAERIHAGEVTVNGVIAQQDDVLRPEDHLIRRRAPWIESPAPNYVDVVFEDDEVLALSKPPGLQVLPAAMLYQRTVLGLLTHHYGSRAGHQQAAGDTVQGAAHAGATAMSASSAEASPAVALSEPQPPAALPAPVHRLGRGTSGLLLLAKSARARRLLPIAMEHTTVVATAVTSAAHRHGKKLAAAAKAGGLVSQPPPRVASHEFQEQQLQSQLQAQPVGCIATGLQSSCTATNSGIGQHSVRKMYRALVQGLVAGGVGATGEVKVPIGRVPCAGVAGGLFAACPDGGKPAHSVWKVLHTDDARNASLMEVEIFTGRPHQIRIHMASIGHPLVGDPLYGPGGTPMQNQGSTLRGSPHGEHMGCAQAGGVEVGENKQCCLPEDHAPGNTVGGGTNVLPGSNRSGGPATAVPGDCGYLLHSHQLWVAHPSDPGRILHLVAPPPPELLAPWE